MIQLEGAVRFYTPKKLMRLDDFDDNSTFVQIMFAVFNGFELLLLFWVMGPLRISANYDRKKKIIYEVVFWGLLCMGFGFLVAGIVLSCKHSKEWRLF